MGTARSQLIIGEAGYNLYRVTVTTDNHESILHDPYCDELQLINPVVTLEMGKSGSFSFQISHLNENRNQIKLLKSIIKVYCDNEIIFSGRVIGDDGDFYNVSTIECEGELSYLIDSVQRPFSFSGTLYDFISYLINVHNEQVEDNKKFEVGDILVTSISADFTREIKETKNTLDILKAQLINICGGHFRVRYHNQKRYIDYVYDYGGINSQIIRFGENLLNLKNSKDPTTIITALIPYGATPKTDNSTNETVKPINIESVNNGKDYIFNQSAVDSYGWIWGTHIWKDINEPQILKQTAEAFLTESIVLPNTLELTAVDLGLIDIDIQKLNLGYWTQIESIPHNINKQFILSKKVINLDNPGKDQVILGQTIPTFTEESNKSQIEISDRVEQIANSTLNEIDIKINNATQLITGGKGGYIITVLSEDGHPEETLYMDTPSMDTAKKILRINKNGIGFSKTGINGPYLNAWTIDGNFLADFITAGTMLADRIRGGTLEIGGAGLGKDGIIYVKNTDGTVIAQIDKDGVKINQGSINIGKGAFEVTSGGVLTLRGTNNSTSIGCSVLAAQYANIDRLIVNSNCEFRDISVGDLWCDDIQGSSAYFSNWCYSPDWTYGSMKSMKEDIKPMDPKKVIDIIMSLKPVTFKFREEYGGKRSMGFIWDDVKKIQERLHCKDIPLVSECNGHGGISYGTYVGLLVLMLQEQQKQINELKEVIKING